jgi:hypothetical protein
MTSIIILLLILLENSLAIVFPYNVLALTYLTYLAYKKGRNGIFEVLIICAIVSSNGNTFIEVGIIFILIFISSLLLTKVFEYKQINIFYYTLVQFVIYGAYLYMKLPYFSFYQGIGMFFGYLLFNYMFIKGSRK